MVAVAKMTARTWFRTTQPSRYSHDRPVAYLPIEEPVIKIRKALGVASDQLPVHNRAGPVGVHTNSR